MIVPVSSLSRLTSEALTTAASLGDEVRAVTVCYPDPEDRAALHALEPAWAEWGPGVELVRLSCAHRSLGRPIAAHVREVTTAEPAGRVTVLIPEAEPAAVAAAAAEPARCGRALGLLPRYRPGRRRARHAGHRTGRHQAPQGLGLLPLEGDPRCEAGLLAEVVGDAAQAVAGVQGDEDLVGGLGEADAFTAGQGVVGGFAHAVRRETDAVVCLLRFPLL